MEAWHCRVDSHLLWSLRHCLSGVGGSIRSDGTGSGKLVPRILDITRDNFDGVDSCKLPAIPGTDTDTPNGLLLCSIGIANDRVPIDIVALTRSNEQ